MFEKLVQRYDARLVAMMGFGGALCIAGGALITALFYEGSAGEPYRIWNHFVSELGEVGVSQLAGVFNGSLIVGGLLITLFMIGVALRLPGWFRYIFGAAGLVTGMSGMLVGVFPMNNLEPHIRVAMRFFNMGLVTMGLFSLFVLLDKQRRFPKWLLIPGALAVACFAAFLYFPFPSDNSAGLATTPDQLFANRPDVWWLAIMEWSVIGAVLAWVSVVSLYFWIQAQKSQPPTAPVFGAVDVD